MPNGFIKNLEGETIEIVDAQARTDLATKLEEPSSGLEVGKYFRVASIDADGHAVLEACDLPVANNGNMGIISASTELGYYVSNEYNNAFACGTYDYNTLKSKHTSSFIGKGSFFNARPYYVKDALISTTDPAWTATEQASARARLGAEAARGKWELIEEFDWNPSTSLAKKTEPNGTPYDFKAVKVLVHTAVATKSISANVRIGYNDYTTSYYFGISNGFHVSQRWWEFGADCYTGHVEAYGTHGSGEWGVKTMNKGYNSNPPLVSDKIDYVYFGKLEDAPTEGNTVKIYAIRA